MPDNLTVIISCKRSLCGGIDIISRLLNLGGGSGRGFLESMCFYKVAEKFLIGSIGTASSRNRIIRWRVDTERAENSTVSIGMLGFHVCHQIRYFEAGRTTDWAGVTSTNLTRLL